MVKTRIGDHPKIFKAKFKEAVEDIFGKSTLTHRKITETIDAFGQLSNRTTTDTVFKGDLQTEPYLLDNYLEAGLIEIGDAVLFMHPDALATLPQHGEWIIDGNSSVAGTYKVWEIIEILEKSELTGTVVAYVYRLIRRDQVIVT
jgi:hypothetical protein